MVCINPWVYCLAAVGKHRLMLFDRHIRAAVCLNNQDELKILRLCLDVFFSKSPLCWGSVLSVLDELKKKSTLIQKGSSKIALVGLRNVTT